MSFSVTKSITVPAQETQEAMQKALAAALAEALGKQVDSAGTKVLIEGEMGFAFIINGSSNVGISVSNSNFNHTVQQSKTYTSPTVVDYCCYGEVIAVGLRASTAAIALTSVFSRTENNDPVMICLQANSSVFLITENATAALEIDTMLNVKTNAYIFLQKLPAVYLPCVIHGIYSVVSAPNIGTNAVFEANNKHYQLLCSTAANARLAMAID